MTRPALARYALAFFAVVPALALVAALWPTLGRSPTLLAVGLVLLGAIALLVSALRRAQDELERRTAAAERRQESLRALVEVTRRLTRGLDPSVVLGGISEAAAAVLGGEAAFRLVEGEFLVRTGATTGAEAVMPRERLRIGESLSGRVAATGEPIVSADIAADDRIIPEQRATLRDDRVGALLCVPIRVGSRILGTLNVYRERGHRFDDDAIALARSLADQAGIALENARIYPFLFAMELPDLVQTVFHDMSAALALAPADASHETLVQLARERAALARVAWNPYLYNPLLTAHARRGLRRHSA